MSAPETRAYCTDLADNAHPTGTPSGDLAPDELTAAHTLTMHEKIFEQCMSDEGQPLP
ncbi:hypothetical protein [Streptomyces sp. NPDC002133]|uniref:hypothetical protein n=1 Tax=Streptomyces sp. NPDC002133 TaxID=3154409 RepID=UPI0033224809